MKQSEVIVKPLITEKSTIAQESGKYVFHIDPRANKVEVKQAVEQAFSVTVLDVNITKNRGQDEAVRPQNEEDTRHQESSGHPQNRETGSRSSKGYKGVPLRIPNPKTPGTRDAALPSFEEVTTSKPEKSLLRPQSKSSGRNNRGRVTLRHRGGRLQENVPGH